MLRRLAVLILLVAAGVGIYWYASRPPTELVLTGVVTTHEVIVSPQITGRIDRLLVEEGDTVGKDQIVAVLALHLGVEKVAVTVMTNLGFHALMAEHGIEVVTTPVGDRYVLEALRRKGGVLGGEQSGHVIWLDGHVTGDGLAAALLLCDAIRGKTLSEAVSVMQRYPQVLRSVRVAGRDLSADVAAEIERANAEFGDSGRVLVRPSGTEPVFRVLVEAENEDDAERVCASIAALVQQELG